jgi:hypothetical protein
VDEMKFPLARLLTKQILHTTDVRQKLNRIRLQSQAHPTVKFAEQNRHLLEQEYLEE